MRTPLFTARSVPFVLFHLTPLLLFTTGWSWTGFYLLLFTYVTRMFGVVAGYHRYFAHRTYKMGRVMQFLMAWLAQSSLQKGVIWWAAHHRHHHAFSDREEDVHSPGLRGFWWSHIGWVLAEDWEATDEKSVRDLMKFPELVWLQKWHWVPGVSGAVVLLLAFGWPGLLWGFFLSTILVWHATFTINSLCHVIGKRVYQTTDTSKNSAILALITLGEGWHNNHHFYQRCAAQGWRWYEFDIAYWGLRLLQVFRLVSGVSGPPEHVMLRTIDHETLTRRDAGKGGALRMELLYERVEALCEAAEALTLRSESVRVEARNEPDQTVEHIQQRLDALHEAAAALATRADAIFVEIKQSTDRSVESLHEKVEAIQQTAQQVLESSAQSPNPA